MVDKNNLNQLSTLEKLQKIQKILVEKDEFIKLR